MIHLTNISKQYGERVLFANASLQINPGEKVGLVGPNGAGKTTIFRLIMKEERMDSGYMAIPEKLKVGYFSQDVCEMKGRSILSETESGVAEIGELVLKLQDYENQLEDSAQNPLSDDEMENLLKKYGEVQSQFEMLGGYDLESRAREILTGLGFPPEEHHHSVDTLSGGWKMRIALAKILLLNPDVILMDEPTNHLDMESIIWLESWLKAFKGSLLMTSHDREFMNRVVSKIIEVANKNITTYSGNYDFYEKERVMRKEQLLAAHARQQEMLAKEEDFIARFAARASHAAQVQSRVKKIEKIERIEIPPEERTIHFEFPVPPRGGDEVVRFENLEKIYNRPEGSDKLVFSGASGLVKRLDRVAVVGVNGAGKSTLLKIMAGQITPTAGTLQQGASIQMGYFSQSSLDVLNPNKTVFEEVFERLVHPTVGYVKSLLGCFKFSGEEVEKKVSVLSGGEKSRLVLATILAQPVNFLILDEPTNHLDIGSREVLLEALKKFEGTVVMVSHDRFFLKELTTRVFELHHHQLINYEGNFDYYLWKKEQSSKNPT